MTLLLFDLLSCKYKEYFTRSQHLKSIFPLYPAIFNTSGIAIAVLLHIDSRSLALVLTLGTATCNDRPWEHSQLAPHDRKSYPQRIQHSEEGSTAFL